VTTQTYGLSPTNTTITFSYLAGGGASSNASIGELTRIISVKYASQNGNASTLVTNNPSSSIGGGDADTVDELKMNTLAEFPTQWRAVTQQDYLARVLCMPPIYGKVSKAYIAKNDQVFSNYVNGDPAQQNPLLITLYVLGLDTAGNLAEPTPALLQNVQTYIQDYRMLTDSVKIEQAYIVNIGVAFDIVILPNYNGQDVVARCITALQDFFKTDNWQINQPIILTNIYSMLDQVKGVQTVKNVTITNLADPTGTKYSQYAYDISGATVNNVIYPSLDPCIFEVLYPNTDISGRVVTF
jgi:hypothetical protein